MLESGTKEDITLYLKKIKIWNFRKFGEKEDNKPGVEVEFSKKFNIIIGENDAGKSSIIDAIYLTLGTISAENPRITEKDFYSGFDGIKDNLKIECIFADLTEEEAGVFLEWLSFNNMNEYELEVRLIAKILDNDYIGKKIEKNIKAGPLDADFVLERIPKELLKTTYLKPLRDAENELRPGFKSRLAQILRGHSAFRVDKNETHVLEEIVSETNQKIEDFFKTTYKDEKTIIGEITFYLNEFFNKSRKDSTSVYQPRFQVTPAKLSDILKKLSLDLDDNVSGLGSLNLLFIAAELLLLNEGKKIGPSLTLIEEIEAHLHPQAQLRLIKFLQGILEDGNESNGQFIISTHSTTLAASTPLENIILIHNNNAYPMNFENTELEKEDYEFLERFLDTTKANLFFARGVILVEGDAENLLLPALAEVIDRPLHKYGVSIVNLGNTAFKRYAKIFSRSEEWIKRGLPPLKLPISLITDVDVKPYIYYEIEEKELDVYSFENEEQLNKVLDLYELKDDELPKDILGKEFSTLKKIKDALEDNLLICDDKDEVLRELTLKKIDDQYISMLEKDKKERLESYYKSETSNIEIFIAPHWTLEYVLALSSLKKELAVAIHYSRYKNPESESNMTKLQTKITELNKEENIVKDAYTLFKPINEKVVSKAIVAQQLSKNLLIKKDEIKKIIEDDPYLRYLVNAIYHVTEPKGER